MKERNRNRGFTLIELLIVVTIILIIAAFTIPRLTKAQIPAHEASALASIKAMTEGAWGPYNTAARYMLESVKDYDAGLQLVDKSIAAKEHWYNLWTKAQLLAAKGKYKDAMTYAQKAKALGDKTPQAFFMADDVNKALKDWKGNKS